jgi:hypothetical protein
VFLVDLTQERLVRPDGCAGKRRGGETTGGGDAETKNQAKLAKPGSHVFLPSRTVSFIRVEKLRLGKARQYLDYDHGCDGVP